MSAAETRKVVTVLFCDVTGSTELGERLDPEALRGVMLRYFEVARAVLERHGGTVEKFIGDAVMAVFGVPAVHEDDALRAVRAADELRGRLAELNEELEPSASVRLEARIGINTGEVVAGEGATTLATGDAVNTASRLQEAAEAGQTLLGDATYRLVAHAVKAWPLDELALKGKREGVRAWRLDEVEAHAPTILARLDSPLVGRDWELRLLRETFARVLGGQCEVVTALGAAGVGKSRLAQEFAAGLDEARIATGRCLAYGDGITFWPILDVIRQLAGITDVDSPKRARAAIADLVADDPDAQLVVSRVAEVLGLGGGGSAAPEVFWALRRLFELVAAAQPLVLVLEDIHWAEPTLLDLVESIARWSEETPLLLVCLARPELLEARPSWGDVSRVIELSPLDQEETLELIDNLAGGAASGDVAERIARATEGNPLFAEEMVWMLVEQGALADRGRRAPPLPPTIQALLAARLDALEPDERAVVQRAAVAGKQFPWSAVEALSPEELKPRVSELLHALVRKKLVLPDVSTSFSGENAFRFAHILVLEAAYQALPKELRAELHERFADWLVRKAGERAGEYEEIIGFHLEQAYRSLSELGPVGEDARRLAERGAALLGSAGRRAFGRDDVPAAATLLDRAVALMTDQDPARVELERELSLALWSVGEIARAESLLNGVIETAQALGDRRQEWYAVLERSARRRMIDPATEADDEVEVAERALAVFEELGDELGLARALRQIAWMHRDACRFDAGREASERALAHARRAADGREISRSADALCTCLLYGPTPAEEAAARCEEILSEAEGNLLMEANVLASLAGLDAMRGRVDAARSHAARAERVYEELGLRFAVAGLMQVVGAAELLADDAFAAERAFRRAYDILAAVQGKGFTAALLGEALLAQGRNAEAAGLTALARETSGGELATEVMWRGLEARLYGRAVLAEEAVEIAGATDALNLHADALLALADVLAKDGTEGASEAARTALELYERKGNAAAASKARGRLGSAAPMP